MPDIEFKKRQISKLEKSLADYHEGRLPLQTLIGNFEFIRDASDWLESEDQKSLNSILIDLESFNAVIVEEGELPSKLLELELKQSLAGLRSWLLGLKQRGGF